MAEIRNGIRHFLANPKIYDIFQHIVGAYTWRQNVVKDLISPILVGEDRIIDIGCGTGDILHYFPNNISYVGFDRNPIYIEAARKQFKDRNAIFNCKSVGEDGNEELVNFDIAIAFGLMHHLDDHEVIELLKTAKKVLKKDGLLFMLDPVLISSQSRLARYIVKKDRGQNVRNLDDYVKLCYKVFSNVKYRIDMQPILIPYTGVVITCS